MENENPVPAPSQLQLPPPQVVDDQRRQKQIIISVVVIFVILLVILVGGVIYLLQPTAPTERIRDIFIIFMALESLILGLALVTLIVQLARLINLLQNEIKPILESTNETVSTLRGTTTFISENMVEPVIKMNEYVAALSQMVKLVGLGRRRP
jgi:hypothetical protein